MLIEPQYAQIQQDFDSDSGKWFVVQDQMIGNANFICQSPKIPKVSSAAAPLIITHLWLTIFFVIAVYIF